jgi:hypothetical protein
MIRNEVEVVETTRQRLGPVGVWLAAAQAAIDLERQAARRIEKLGYGSIWTPEELAGKEAFAHHVVVQPLGDLDEALRQLENLAPALLGH